MNPQSPVRAEPEAPVPTFSPRFALTSGSQRKIAIAVDLSDESAYAVRWAVQNYLRPGDAVILLHVRPTSVLYGADWGSVDLSASEDAGDGGGDDEESRRKLEDDFDNFTSTKASDLAHPLVEAQIPFKIHIVKDHDMKERLCLEVERLGLSAVIMGSRGFGASKRAAKGRLGSVSDYCVHHCVCPVVVVRYPRRTITVTVTETVVVLVVLLCRLGNRLSFRLCRRKSMRCIMMLPMSTEMLNESIEQCLFPY